MTEDMDVTTLGRGASDITAVALAAALKADLCELYKDVDGIMTADPRLAARARLIDEIDHEEMLELAQQGAGVIHPRSVELAAVYGVPLVVRSSFNDNPGTLIHGGVKVELRNKVRGIAHDTDVAKVTLQGVADRPGISAALFEPLAEAGVSVDVIVQNASAGGVSARPGSSSLSRARSGPSRSSRPTASPRSRSSGQACSTRPATPRACSAPWPTGGSTSR
jgi:aspartate kinase